MGFWTKNTGHLVARVENAFCRSDQCIMVFEILTIIWRYTRLLGKFDLWWPLETSILTLARRTQIVSKELGTSYRTFFFFFFATMSGSRGSRLGPLKSPRTKPSHLEPARNMVQYRSCVTHDRCVSTRQIQWDPSYVCISFQSQVISKNCW